MTQNTLVHGESFASTDEAVVEARFAMKNASCLGCKTVSVGNGDGSGALERLSLQDLAARPAMA